MLPLLLAVIVAGAEQQTAPHPYEPPRVEVAAPAVALARDAQGVAMAWSMPNAAGVPRIHVARLDPSGNLGAVREMPVVLSSARSAAVHPSMSRRAGADGFLITWLEAPTTRAQAAYALLDGTLHPERVVRLPGVMLTSPPLARTGDVMWLTSNARFWHIETDGSARGPFETFWPASDMIAASAGVPFLVSGWRDPKDFQCAGRSGCLIGHFPGISYCQPSCRIPRSALRLLVPYDVIESTPLPFITEAEPAIERDGDTFLVAWFRGAQKTGGEVVLSSVDPAARGTFAGAVQAPLVLGRFGRDSGPTRPDAEVTEQGTYVVWRTASPAGGHDVVGALVGRDGAVEPFTVAASAADERDPSILALENGALLVAYRKIENDESTIAWRMIGERPSRRRAVR